MPRHEPSRSRSRLFCRDPGFPASILALAAGAITGAATVEGPVLRTRNSFLRTVTPFLKRLTH